MKKNQWLRLGLLALATTIALPTVAQRKGKVKSKVATVVAKPKAGHYLIQGTAPAEANGKWVYLYTNSGTALDSVKVVGGKFHFERPVGGDGIVANLIVPRSFSLSFIPEEGVIMAPLEAEAATGTPLNDIRAQKVKEEIALSSGVKEKLMKLRSDKTLSDQQKEEGMEKVVKEYYAQILPGVLADLKAHRDDALGYYALQTLLAQEDIDLAKAEGYLKEVSESLRNEETIVKQVERLRRLEATKPGAQFVDFDGVDDASKPVSLSCYVGKGHYVLVDFWASWCGPCRREITHLKKVRDAYTDKGLVILGAVVWDKMEDHLQAMKDLEITWPQIFNDKDATDLYGIAGIPQLILFDPSGKIVARDLRGEQVNAQLDEILKTTGGKL